MAPEWPLSPLDQIPAERGIAADGRGRRDGLLSGGKINARRGGGGARTNENKDVTHAFFALKKIGTYSNEVHSLSLLSVPCSRGSRRCEEGKGGVILILFLSGATDCNFHSARRRNDETVTQHRSHYHLDKPQLPHMIAPLLVNPDSCIYILVLFLH